MFELTEEQRLVQETARRFAEEDIAPTLREEESKHEFRAEIPLCFFSLSV